MRVYMAAEPDKGEAHARKVRSYLMPLLEDIKPVKAIFGYP